jgi:hypothetical protein
MQRPSRGFANDWMLACMGRRDVDVRPTAGPSSNNGEGQEMRDDRHPINDDDITGSGRWRGSILPGVVAGKAIGRQPSAASSTTDALTTKHRERSLLSRVEPV